MDALSLGVSMLFYVAGLVTIALSLRSTSALEAGHGEYYSLLLGSIAGMVLLAEAESLMTLFIGFELLSIPLYVLCASDLRRRTSLESGLKYLVVGSVGSATLLYGLALIYGATGAMEFDAIATALASTDVDVSTRSSSPASRSRPPGWRSRRRSRPSTSGRRTSTRAPPRRSPPSWQSRPRPPRSRS